MSDTGSCEALVYCILVVYQAKEKVILVMRYSQTCSRGHLC